MLSIEETMKLETCAELEEQVEQRRKLMSEMVGTLYPYVICGEISRINSRIFDIKQGKTKAKENG